MIKPLPLAVGLALLASPALSESSPRPDDRDSYSDRRDRDRDRGWGRDGWRDDERGRPDRGARFMVRNGDAVVSVRCDGSESMRACVDATLTLLERVRSMPPAPTSGPSPGPAQPPR
jgi:hypothetical protein